MRQRVDDELEALEKQGVWKKVRYAKTAAPIVTVLKDKEDPGGHLVQTPNICTLEIA